MISRRAFSCVSMSILPNIIRVLLQISCVILHSLLLDDFPSRILLFLCLLSRILFGPLSRLVVLFCMVYCWVISRVYSLVSLFILPNIIRVLLQISCVIIFGLLLDDFPPSILVFLCLFSRILFGSLFLHFPIDRSVLAHPLNNNV